MRQLHLTEAGVRAIKLLGSVDVDSIVSTIPLWERDRMGWSMGAESRAGHYS